MPVVRSMSVRVRGLLLVLALISPGAVFAPAAFAAQPAAAQVNAIRAINVEGNRRVEPETVRSYMQVQPGDPFDSDNIDKSLKSLFATIRSLVEQGVTIVYISHRLNEIFEIADNVTVLRSGKKVATLPVLDPTKLPKRPPARRA